MPDDQLHFLAALRPSLAPGTTRRVSRWGRAPSWPWPTLLVLLLCLPVVLAPPLNHDVAGVLDFSQRWLAGGHLYGDLIDVNPPLIFVLTLAPAAVAHWTGLPPAVVLRVFVLALGVLVMVLARGVRARGREGRCERATLDALPALLCLGAGYDFGQREHLMALAALPYLLAAGRRAEGERPARAVSVAVLAAIGFALKPYFLAVPALVELAVFLAARARGRRGWDDATPWAMGVVWAIYLASFPIVFPDYARHVVPLALTLYPAIGNRSMLSLLTEPRLTAAIVLVAVMLAVAARVRPARVMAAAALGALISTIAQGKGWSYHILPPELFAAAGLSPWVARRRDWGMASRPVAAAAAMMVVALVYAAIVGRAPWREIAYERGPVATLSGLIASAAGPGEPVLVLSPAVYPVYPAITYAGVRTVLPAMDMWMLQGAYGRCLPSGKRYRERAEMPEAELFLLDSVLTTMRRDPPTAIVIDRQPGIPWCGSEFDFLTYFSREPAFAAAFAAYRLVGEWDGYRVFARDEE